MTAPRTPAEALERWREAMEPLRGGEPSLSPTPRKFQARTVEGAELIRRVLIAGDALAAALEQAQGTLRWHEQQRLVIREIVPPEQAQRIYDLEAENARLREALERIERITDEYPGAHPLRLEIYELAHKALAASPPKEEK